MIICGGVGMRILLIEDEKRMAQALCEILRLEKAENLWYIIVKERVIPMKR